jgi:OOP family OmpA-OmpF porin
MRRQMPVQTIAIKKWAYDHRTDIENMIIALAQAGDQVKSFHRSPEICGRGQRRGLPGTKCRLLAEVLQWRGRADVSGADGTTWVVLRSSTWRIWPTPYGLGADKVDRYKAVYNTFGNLMVKMYPAIMPSFMPYEKAVDKSFLLSVISNHPELLEGKAIETKYASQITARSLRGLITSSSRRDRRSSGLSRIRCWTRSSNRPS